MLDLSDPDDIDRFAARGTAILVRVETARGSTPRTAGTAMLVSRQALLGTIGGGQLEYIAIDAARQMLGAGETQRLLPVPLGPQIGQCCGGHVQLALTLLDGTGMDTLRAQARAAIARRPHVYLFGAGHVGRALARALLPLPVSALLVDSRAEELALCDPMAATHCTPLPEALVRDAPPGSAFIILTHDHALDFLLAREALERQARDRDVAYVGMIGSKTKRATFARWLEEETGSRTALAHLTMPIGASRLADKRPAVIAAMVVPELLEALSTQQHASESA